LDQNRQVDVASVLSTVAQQLNLNKNQLNNVDNAGTHGQRIASAFAAAASAAQNSGSNDAGQQLQAAAQAMRQQGQGKAAGFYAQGLEQAAAKFAGQSGISAASLGTFLQSFLGGVQKNNAVKPGQGGMLDALGPAVNAYLQSQQGGNMQQAITNALGAAISGTSNTASGGSVDPGAASVTNVLGGIFSAIAPQLIGNALSGSQQGGAGSGLGNMLGGLLSGGAGQQAQAQAQSSGGMGWLTGLVGGMANNSQVAGSQGGNLNVGGLLNDLMGSQGAQGANSGENLGSMLDGMLGGNEQSSQS